MKSSIFPIISLDDIIRSSGSIHRLAQEQAGCRFLQQKLEERDPVTATIIFQQTKQYLPEMMTDPFGNYLFQKLCEYVSVHERTQIIATVKNDIVNAALNLHGTRSIQRIIELASGREQLEYLTNALKGNIVNLCVNPNGNHVVQRALLQFEGVDRDLILNAIGNSCTEISTHRHGCCVMQRCFDAASGKQRSLLVRQISDCCLELMQDPYGNYVIQYVLDHCSDSEVNLIVARPLGRLANLSRQKFSSNVIEKCLEKANNELCQQYVDELCQPVVIRELLHDQYANYVLQKAMQVSSHDQGIALVNALKPHLASIRNTGCGKRIVSKILRKYNAAFDI